MTSATVKQAPAEVSPWMTFNEIGRRYGGSRAWIYTAITRGDLPKPIPVGGKRLFCRAAQSARL